MFAQSPITGYGLPGGAKDPLTEIRYGLRSPNFATRVQAVKDFAALLPAVLVEENAFIEELGKYEGEDLDLCGNQVLIDGVNDAVAYLNLAVNNLCVTSFTRDVDRMAQVAYFFNLLGQVVFYAELQSEGNAKLLQEVAESKAIVEKQEERKTRVALEDDFGMRLLENSLLNLNTELEMKDAEIAKLKEKLSEYEAAGVERDAMCQRIEEADLAARKANTKVADLEEQVERLRRSLDAERDDCDDVEAELERAEKRIAKLEEELLLSALQGAVDQQNAYIQQLEENADVAEEAQNVLADKEEELRAERMQRDVVESGLNSQLGDMTMKVLKGKQMVGGLQQALLEVREEAEKCKMDVSDLQELVEKQNARLQTFYLQEEALTSLKSAVASKDELLLEVTTEVQSLKTKLEDVSKDHIRTPRSLAEALELIKPFTRQ